MESTFVAIVGAGPAGLVLGLALAQRNVRSIILEQQPAIGNDPRGVYLTGDSLRILTSLGLGDKLASIGHGMTEPHAVMFHSSAFNRDTFYNMDLTKDVFEHGLPTGILQDQPSLEGVLRTQLSQSAHCQLRVHCQVTNIEERDENIVLTYQDKHDNTLKQLNATFLIGADGKRGIVRKQFLEPRADIRQVDGTYPYEGTWIAANLKLALPTPESHPGFSLWQAGYSPEQVYDLFWPRGWHFCAPPGRPLACGRFGPHSNRCWRFEIAIDGSEADPSSAETLMWTHLLPSITRVVLIEGKLTPVVFPRDCIEVVRCRPFTFAHKVVNRWFDGRTILVGDAAHVFPPFAGQGIGSGIRDSHQLAWRIDLLKRLRATNTDDLARRLFKTWSAERRSSINTAAYLTLLNGKMCTGDEPIWLRLGRAIDQLAQSMKFLGSPPNPQQMAEARGFTGTKGLFGIAEARGGVRLAQTWVTQDGKLCILSDRIFARVPSCLSVLVIGDSDIGELVVKAQKALATVSIDPMIVSIASIIPFVRHAKWANRVDIEDVYSLATVSQIRANGIARDTSGIGAFLGRLGAEARFALVRPDHFVFSVARSATEFQDHLQEVQKMLT